MDLLTDNTSLHAVGRCIDGEAQGDSDVDQLLSLVSELIYADSVSISTFEPPETLSPTEHVLSYLTKKSGYDGQAFTRIDIPEDKFASHCAQAASRFRLMVRDAQQLSLILSHKASGARRPNMGSRSQHFSDVVDKLIRGEDIEKSDAEIRSAALNEKIGSVLYTLKCHDSGLDILQRKATTEWRFEWTENILAIVRCFINCELAHSRGASYSPSVARARTYEGFAFTPPLASELDRGFHVAFSASGTPPAMVQAALFIGRGDINGVIEAALQFRDFMKPLRQEIKRLNRSNAPADSPEYQNIVSDYTDRLFAKIGTDREPKWTLWNLYRINPVMINVPNSDGFPTTIPIPVPRKAEGAPGFWEFVKDRRNVILLTGLGRKVPRGARYDEYYSRLRSNCTRNSP